MFNAAALHTGAPLFQGRHDSDSVPPGVFIDSSDEPSDTSDGQRSARKLDGSFVTFGTTEGNKASSESANEAHRRVGNLECGNGRTGVSCEPTDIVIHAEVRQMCAY